ncbi:MAG TPA: transcription termination factor NusA [Candidatus Paceibacterota bacterium]
MLDLKTINSVLGEFEDRGISKQTMIEAIETAMATAYKKEYGKRGQVVRAKLDLNTGTVSFEQVKTVVDESSVRFPEEGEVFAPEPEHHFRDQVRTLDEPELMEGELPRYDEEKHMLIKNAQMIKRGAEVGEEIVFPLEPQDDFGRIAAQTAKQVVIQKVREAEKLSILEEFGHKKGEIVGGIVQRMERGALFIDLGRATGIIPYEEQIPGERYRPGERIRAYLYSVDEGFRGVYLRLSRSHPRFLVKLFEMEVPELASGAIEVKGLAREPGSRTKIAVASSDPHVDPVGSFVGQRGVRVSTVMGELGGERIDIIEWSEDPKAYIKESLSPATVLEVELDEADHRAKVEVSDDQQSLAIGRGGQNVRLAAKLTGWNIDIMSSGTEVAESDGETVDMKKADEPAPAQVSIANAEEEIENEEEAEENDPAKEAGLSPDQDSIVLEEEPKANTLGVGEETAFTDNGSVADGHESRDESSESMKDAS